MSDRKFNIAILGAGAWATALGCCASLNAHHVKLWGINPEQVADINNGFNRSVFGDTKLFAKLEATTDFKHAVQDADVVLIATPSTSIKEVVQKVLTFFKENKGSHQKTIDFVNVAKGFDLDTDDVWSKSIKKYFQGFRLNANLVSLIGPSFAIDVMNQFPTAINAVSSSMEASQRIAHILTTNFLMIKIIEDECGAQVLSALKNFLAIAVGMWNEAFDSSNTHAMILTLGINEIRKLSSVFGFDKKTIFELCGIGDIFLTCNSPKSRNFSFGCQLYKLNSVEKALEQKITVEGYNVCDVVSNLIKKHNLNLPIFSSLIEVLHDKIKPRDAVKDLSKIFEQDK